MSEGCLADAWRCVCLCLRLRLRVRAHAWVGGSVALHDVPQRRVTVSSAPCTWTVDRLLLCRACPCAGQLPRFAAWVEQCKLNAEGTLTLHDAWGMMLGGVKCEPPSARCAALRPVHTLMCFRAVPHRLPYCGVTASRGFLRAVMPVGLALWLGH